MMSYSDADKYPLTGLCILDLAGDPQLNEHGFFVELKHPLLGEDNRHVFIDLMEMDEDQVKRYVAEGIIA